MKPMPDHHLAACTYRFVTFVNGECSTNANDCLLENLLTFDPGTRTTRNAILLRGRKVPRNARYKRLTLDPILRSRSLLGTIGNIANTDRNRIEKADDDDSRSLVPMHNSIDLAGASGW